MKQKEYWFSIDRPEKSKILKTSGELFFGGWFLDKNGNPAEKIYAQIGDNVAMCSRAKRNDVAKHFNTKYEMEVSSDCGFRGWISFGQGIKYLKLIAVTQERKEIVLSRYLMHSGKNDNNLHDESVIVEARKYEKWIAAHDNFNNADRTKIIELQKKFEHQPLISILMPTYNTPEIYLREVIDSVLEQTYDNWQFCICDDNSPDPHMKKVLEEYQAKDSRIEVVYRTENGHISKASNSALEIAKGEFTALLDHDDILPPYALSCLVYQINQTPDANLIFSDEDKIDEYGHRMDPYFKSDWNYELFLSHNCVSHLGVYRTSILKEIKGFNPDLVGSQDWDMALRFIEKIPQETIQHIPHVLYHWRVFENSTAMSIDAKPYAIEAGRKSVQSHLDRINTNAKVTQGAWPGSQRIQYEIGEQPLVSILIPSKNQLDFISMCIQTLIENTSYKNYEILILDNGSDDPDVKSYYDTITAKHALIKIIDCSGPFNFSKINNTGVQQAKGEYICFLNNDIEITESNWLDEMVSNIVRKEVGVVGAKLLFPHNLIQHAGIVTGIAGLAGHVYRLFPPKRKGHQGRAALVQEMTAVTAACMLTSKSLFLELGGFNESELAVAYNDLDYCLKVREQKLKVIWTPYAELVHHESVSRGYENTEEKKQRLAKEQKYILDNWSKYISNDPYYNPNLASETEDASYAFPPRVKKFWQE